MEPKIKTAKELKIEVAEAENGVGKDSGKMFTRSTIPMSNKQEKARAANKRAKKARKINRK